MQNESEEYKIYVGALDEDLEEEEFVAAFQRHGEIVSWSLTAERCFGFISYRHRRDAEKAIENMNFKFLGHRPMKVEWAFGWPREDIPQQTISYDYESVFNRTSENNRTVHCKGLKTHITEEDLRFIFSPFGEIVEINLFNHIFDYAFIHFSTKEAAARAICSINDTEIEGSPVKCNWSYRTNFINNRQPSTAEASSASSSDSNHSFALYEESEDEVEGDDFDRVFNEVSANHRTVYCGGLESSVTNEIIEEIFSPFGIIENINLFNERSDYGFIRFNTKEAATIAICSIDGTLIDGSPVKCNWAHREDSSPEPEASEQDSESSELFVADDCPFSRLQVSLSRFEQISGDLLRTYAERLRLGVGSASSSTPLTENESQGAAGPIEGAAAKPKEKKTDMLCKICMDEELGIVFLPCGHLTSCAKCAQQIHICPLCRKAITKKIRTYLS